MLINFWLVSVRSSSSRWKGSATILLVILLLGHDIRPSCTIKVPSTGVARIILLFLITLSTIVAHLLKLIIVVCIHYCFSILLKGAFLALMKRCMGSVGNIALRILDLTLRRNLVKLLLLLSGASFWCYHWSFFSLKLIQILEWSRIVVVAPNRFVNFCLEVWIRMPTFY